MPKIFLRTSFVILTAIISSSSQADEPFMPYMDPDGSTPREIRCRIADHGTIYHNGVCFFQADVDGSFTVVTGNAKYAASVEVIEGIYAQGRWTGEAYASHMHGQLHELERSKMDPACWENDEFSICAW